MKTKPCPNCNGSGKAGEIPKAYGGGTIKTICFMCVGTKEVDAWDYDRLLKLVKADAIQTEINFK